MERAVGKFEARGDIRGVFVALRITVFGRSILHTLTLILAKEKPKKTESRIQNGAIKTG